MEVRSRLNPFGNVWGIARELAFLLIVPLVSVLAILAAAGWTGHFAPAAAKYTQQVTYQVARTSNDADRALAKFMENVALSHVATPGKPATTNAEAAAPATNAPLPAPAATKPVANPAAARFRKAQVAISAPRPMPARISPAAYDVPDTQAIIAVTPPPAPHLGAVIFAHLRNVVETSDKHVAEGAASLGETLSTLVKRIKS